MEDHSKVHNKPSTQKSYQYQIDTFIVPAFGIKKAHEVTRHDITALMKRMKKSPLQANRILSCLRKMFNLAELWGYRHDIQMDDHMSNGYLGQQPVGRRLHA